MKLGDRLKRAIRNRARRTRQLRNEYRRLRKSGTASRVRAAKAAYEKSARKGQAWRRRLGVLRRALAIERGSNRLWGGSRQVTNEVIRIVGGRAPVTSRKRIQTFGNPDSDHHVSQTTADAVDFGVAEAHNLKNEISRRLGGPNELADYGAFHVKRGGRTFRVQLIAGTHGTGPHLHVGVRRQ